MKIAIIGAGASGLFAGGLLANKYDVTIFDKNEKCGKKLFITGKGRCNLANNCDKEVFFNNIVNGKKFMFSSISQITPKEIISYFEKNGLKIKTERGGRVFPLSDKSSDVIKTLQKLCEKCNLKLNEEVIELSYNQILNNFSLKTTLQDYVFDKVIVATGGKSYPLTGSTGDGYKFAKSFGHTIVQLKPALVAIELNDDFVKDLQGVSLKNVELNCITDKNNYKFFGEMLFTDKGISGPIVLSLSSYINKENVNKLYIDLKPALELQQLNDRLEREITNNKEKCLVTLTKSYLPKVLGQVLLEKLSLPFDTKLKSLTFTQKKQFTTHLKEFDLSFKKLYPLESGIITSGGINLKEINPKTMESKFQKGLYFIGEVLDVDCLTGGFNLTTAFSTAFACANNL